MQMMLLERQNKKRLMMARQEQNALPANNNSTEDRGSANETILNGSRKASVFYVFVG